MINWEAIAREHGPLVWRTARRIVGSNEADAADCYQETFLAALALARRNEPVRNWPGLLQRIATARALNILRTRRRNNARMVPDFHLDDASGSGATPGEAAQSDELMERLREALARLPV